MPELRWKTNKQTSKQTKQISVNNSHHSTRRRNNLQAIASLESKAIKRAEKLMPVLLLLCPQADHFSSRSKILFSSVFFLVKSYHANDQPPTKRPLNITSSAIGTSLLKNIYLKTEAPSTTLRRSNLKTVFSVWNCIKCFLSAGEIWKDSYDRSFWISGWGKFEQGKRMNFAMSSCSNSSGLKRIFENL